MKAIIIILIIVVAAVIGVSLAMGIRWKSEEERLRKEINAEEKKRDRENEEFVSRLKATAEKYEREIKELEERKNWLIERIGENRVLDGRVREELLAAEELRKETVEELRKEEIRRKELEDGRRLLGEEIEKLKGEKKKLEDTVQEMTGKAEDASKRSRDAIERVGKDREDGGVGVELGERVVGDIERLKEFVRGMECENEVLKAIYDCYFKMQVERMIRDAGVVGVCGIYRIWDKDGSYIGQSVNVGERWKQHMKRAVGVDESGRIVLYDAMDRKGIEKFRWELVEECERDELSEREKYWGEFYGVKEWGYNKKLG